MQYHEAQKQAARRINEWLNNGKTGWEQLQHALLLKHGLSTKATNRLRKELETLRGEK